RAAARSARRRQLAPRGETASDASSRSRVWRRSFYRDCAPLAVSRRPSLVYPKRIEPHFLQWKIRMPALHRLLAIIALSVVVTAPALRAADSPVRPPNIILILGDDLGAKELSCYGSTRHQTPQLDRMAAEGMRFETFYSMPLCTPTRMALMTGQYGFHNGYLGMSNKAFVPLPGSPQSQIGN